LDKAFERRLALKLEFPFPEKKERLKIWQRFFPKPEKVLAECVNLEDMASYKITGGKIKNIVLNAARRAAYLEQKRIRHEDLMVALERERAGMEAFRTKPRHILSSQDLTTARVGSQLTLAPKMDVDVDVVVDEKENENGKN
jgi:AAA+ superfamily predicted ATPase